MSYSRFTNADVYTFEAVEGHLECCACSLSDEWRFPSVPAFLAHLDEHRAAGHHVPGWIDDAVRADWAAGEFASWTDEVTV